MSKSKKGRTVLDELFAVIQSRQGADPESSHTARLFAQGNTRIAQKLGEEAVETVIEAIRKNAEGIRSESADLLYHLMVLWAANGLKPDDIWAELDRRRGLSGIEEKKRRKSG